MIHCRYSGEQLLQTRMFMLHNLKCHWILCYILEFSFYYLFRSLDTPTHWSNIYTYSAEISHTRITHGHYMDKTISPTCTFCNIEYVSIEHLLDNCSFFETVRRTIFKNIAPTSTLSFLQDKHVSDLINFLKTTNLIKMF